MMNSVKNEILKNGETSLYGATQVLLSSSYSSVTKNDSVLGQKMDEPFIYHFDEIASTILPSDSNGTLNNIKSSININFNDNASEEWMSTLMLIFSASIMIFIIVAAIFGNLLVIISVMRNRKLR